MNHDAWNALDRRARLGMILAIVLTAGMLAMGTYWLIRSDYQVLFADLKPQDTALMVAELDRMKLPYKIGPEGNSILVDAATVHATRLKLMGKDMPLHGAAGFELFNNADFGMTEFAQKITYQRALQGEIARTIHSLSEVQDVRVHLALPEEGLFKRAVAKAKASITLGLKAGRSLRPEQIGGIQRLVAGAVPGISASDVTIVDLQGVALTRTAAADGEPHLGSSPLDLKRETEQLLAAKAMAVLERAFGPGQALVSVDVTLNMDQVRVTTEEVVGAPGANGQALSGVVVRERESTRDVGAPLRTEGESGGRMGTSQREVDYQVGRRVEQVASQPGAIRRVQVAVVIRQPLEGAQVEQLRMLVAAAVGAVLDRGDTVVLQSIKLQEFAQVTAATAGAVTQGASTQAAAAPVASSDGVRAAVGMEGLWAAGAAGILLLALAALAGQQRKRPARELTTEQRQAFLEQLQHWLEPAPQQQLNRSPGERAGQPAKGRP